MNVIWKEKSFKALIYSLRLSSSFFGAQCFLIVNFVGQFPRMPNMHVLAKTTTNKRRKLQIRKFKKKNSF